VSHRTAPLIFKFIVAPVLISSRITMNLLYAGC
jgi:hypothetical protein